MSSKVFTVLEVGMQAVQVEIECRLSNGLPAIVVVGLGNKAVDEAKERVRSAFAEAKLDLPRKRITLNLAPADLPKVGTSFDLGIAAAILQAAKAIKPENLDGCILVGELGLNGDIRPVRGIIGKLLASRSLGLTTFYIPAANVPQASLVPGIELRPVASLADFYLDQTGVAPIQPIHTTEQMPRAQQSLGAIDFADIVGQARAKRALEIAAAGGHNILLNGAPGTGKSMLAKAFRSILPPVSQDELLAINHLHSLVAPTTDVIIYERPVRAPHHSASSTAILGGGSTPRPGEISLAHHGVLFMDEMPEFGRQVLEALRQPLEDHTITVSRALGSITYPADFILVGTANPCPCGYYNTDRLCSCSAAEIVRYQQKLSGPILDRIDLYIEAEAVQHAHLLSSTTVPPQSPDIQKRVIAARALQAERHPDGQLNTRLTGAELKRYAKLAPDAKALLDTAATKLHISPRAYMKVIKVARSIADLDGEAAISRAAIGEALQYRRANP